MNFWETIVESNTFNFAVLLLIFAVLYRKLNISNVMSQLTADIIKKIEDAKTHREEAKQKLMEAKKLAENLDSDIKSRLESAEQKAAGISEQIEINTQNQVKLIEKNLQNLIIAEEKTLSSEMSKKALEHAITLAEQKIIKALKENPKLHDKFIEESIGAI